MAYDDLVISLYIKRQQQSKALKTIEVLSETLKALVNVYSLDRKYIYNSRRKQLNSSYNSREYIIFKKLF